MSVVCMSQAPGTHVARETLECYLFVSDLYDVLRQLVALCFFGVHT
jgi:hypothetical protein